MTTTISTQAAGSNLDQTIEEATLSAIQTLVALAANRSDPKEARLAATEILRFAARREGAARPGTKSAHPPREAADAAGPSPQAQQEVRAGTGGGDADRSFAARPEADPAPARPALRPAPASPAKRHPAAPDRPDGSRTDAVSRQVPQRPRKP